MRRHAAALAALLALAAGRAAASEADPPVARVDGRVIRASEVREIVKNVIAAAPSVPSSGELKEIEEQALESLIDHHLLVGEARRRGLRVEPGVVEEALSRQRERFASEALYLRALERSGLSPEELKEATERALLARMLLEQVVWAGVRVSDAEVERFYREHRNELADGGQDAPALAEVAPAIRRLLLERKREQRREAFLAGLRKKARIERLARPAASAEALAPAAVPTAAPPARVASPVPVPPSRRVDAAAPTP